jgi:predicted AAA+ superfamily ATPase
MHCIGLGTDLTGRNITRELFPFDFDEFSYLIHSGKRKRVIWCFLSKEDFLNTKSPSAEF